MSYRPPTHSSTHALAVVSLVFGIAAWCMLPMLGAVVAIVCGHLARGEIRRAPVGTMEGDGLAIAGLVLGYMQLGLALLTVLIVLSFVLLGVGIGFHAFPWH
jgi:hypothetical protein